MTFGSPQQTMADPYQQQLGYYYQPQKSFRETRAYKFRRRILMFLGILVVLNINIFANRILGIGQLVSPLILLLCILSFLNSKVSWVTGIPLAARMFGGALLFVILLGSLQGFTQGSHKLFELARTILMDLATPIVFFSAVLLSRTLQKMGGEVAEKQVLNICYVLCLIATAAVFIPIIYPAYHELIRGPDGNTERFSGVYGNPNTTSMAALSFIIFGLAKTSRDKSLWHLVIACSIGGLAILYTGSRAGILGIFFIVAPMSAVLFGFKHVFRIVLTLGLMLVFSYLVYLYVVQKADSGTFQSKRWQQTLSIFEDGLTNENTSGRLGLAMIAMDMFQESPILGHGLGSSRPMFPKSAWGPHNYYLVVLVETGLLGFLPFMAFWILVGFKAFDPNIDNWNRVLTLGLFLVISVSGLSSHTIFTERNQVFLLGAALGMAQRKRY